MMDLTELFTQHPRPWIIHDNHEGREGFLAVYDADGSTVIDLGDMEEVEATEIELAFLLVWGSRVVSVVEDEIDPAKFWKKPEA